MDWLRSCYGSEWHFFNDALDVTIQGVYYKCPPDTPFVGTYHNFGSRRWNETNAPKIQGLGESLTAKHSWYNGATPQILPEARQIGDDSCLENGEPISHSIPYSDTYDGFSRACFGPGQLVADTWPLVSSYTSCSIQFFYATIISWLYSFDEDSINVAFQLLVPGCRVRFQMGTPTYPNLVCVTTDDWTILVSDGTQTYQQWALQGFSGIVPPNDFGAIGTQPLWYAASTRALLFMTTCGANPLGKFMCVGHSYGGANASLIAARLRVNNPLLAINLLTYGCPKPGDAQLQALLGRCANFNLVNDRDIVGALPPNFVQIIPVLRITSVLGLTVWGNWEDMPARALMANDGSFQMNESPILSTNTLLELCTNIFNDQPIGTILPHILPEYRQRIFRRCPAPEWPVSADLWTWLLTLPLPVPPVLAFGDTSAPKSNLPLVVKAKVGDVGLALGSSATPVLLAGGLALGTAAIEDLAGLSLGTAAIEDLAGLSLGSSVAAVGLGLGSSISPVLLTGGLALGSSISPVLLTGGLALGSSATPVLLTGGLALGSSVAAGGIALGSSVAAGGIALGSSVAAGGIALGSSVDIAAAGIALGISISANFGEGGLRFGAEYTPTPPLPTPGKTCATAAATFPGVNYDYPGIGDGLTARWFYIDLTAGVWHLTSDTHGGIYPPLYWGHLGACGSQTDLFFVFSTTCFSFTMPTTQRLYLETYEPAGELIVAWRIDPGACP